MKDAFRPESLLPFAVAEPRARDVLRAWYAVVAPPFAVTDTSAYVWTFDARRRDLDRGGGQLHVR